MSKAPKASTPTKAVAVPVELKASASAESQGEFVLYTTDDGLTRVEMRAEGGSLWLSQAEIATLFQTTPQNVTQHVKAIYAEGEADPEATSKSGLQVCQEGAVRMLGAASADDAVMDELGKVADRLTKKKGG